MAMVMLATSFCKVFSWNVHDVDLDFWNGPGSDATSHVLAIAIFTVPVTVCKLIVYGLEVWLKKKNKCDVTGTIALALILRLLTVHIQLVYVRLHNTSRLDNVELCLLYSVCKRPTLALAQRSQPGCIIYYYHPNVWHKVQTSRADT